MKQKLIKAIDWVAELFRDIDEEQATALMRWDDHRRAAEPVAGSGEAMSLHAGPSYLSFTGSSVCITVYDRNGANDNLFCVIYGETHASVTRRADQLISALDGARRL